MDGTDLKAFVAGANLRSASLSLRDRLFVDDREVPEILATIRHQADAELMLLCTCDRVEFQGLSAEPEAALEACLSFLRARAGDDIPVEADSGTANGFYQLTDRAALRHMLAVAASLDSLVVGEPQILAQVKVAHRLARESGAVGRALEALIQMVLATARRVRRDTKIGEGPVSIAAAVIQIARDLHGDLSRCRALVIGNGDMGLLIGEQLLRAGLTDFHVTHPRDARVAATARLLNCPVASYETLADSLTRADIVLSAMNARHHVLGMDQMAAVIKARRHRPVLIVDTGIPGDVEPAVERLDEAFVYDLDDLEQVAHRGRREREQEAVAGWTIVDRAVVDYSRERTERRALPSLVALRDHFEAVRLSVLAEHPDDAPRATRLLINRLLHGPTTELRRAAIEDLDLPAMEGLLSRLFDPGGSQPPDPKTEPLAGSGSAQAPAKPSQRGPKPEPVVDPEQESKKEKRP